MSFSRLPFRAIKPLTVLTVALAAVAAGGCGKDRDQADRAERGVEVKIYGLQTRTDGALLRSTTTEWKRPGATVLETEPNGLPQEDVTTCDYTYTRTDSDTDPYVLGADIDSICNVTGLTDRTEDDCEISTGATRYTSMLGEFEVFIVNNSTSKTQNMAIEGMGVNIEIRNAAGGVVWSLVNDNLDYQDLLAEANNLLAAEGGDACAGRIEAGADSRSLPGFSRFGSPGAPFVYSLTPANSEDMTLRFFWNGKDSNGNDVPAGTYTAHFDITITDTDTITETDPGTQWESPAPIEFTISDADPE